MKKTIQGCIEVLEQGEKFLDSISNEAYTKIVKPYFISSPGEHMRHILDHFLSLMEGLPNAAIDYDSRQRGSDIETDIAQARLQLQMLKLWVMKLNRESLDTPLTIKTEVSLSESQSSSAKSTLKRELIFAASHAIHHYSIMSIALQMQDLQMDPRFGVAPATATHLRAEETCAP